MSPRVSRHPSRFAARQSARCGPANAGSGNSGCEATVKALQVKRSVGRLGLARVASALAPAAAVRVGPLDHTDVDDPELPGPGWHRVHTSLAGICGSDLSMIEGHASTYFDDWVSFPFVPGHEVVGRPRRRDPRRARAGARPRGARLRAAVRRAPRRATATTTPTSPPGHLEPGIQTGFCCSTGGGWAPWFVAHESQLHPIADDMPDERAVLIEPLAGGIHAALLAARVAVRRARPREPRRRRARRRHDGARGDRRPACATCPTCAIVVGARYPHQQQLAGAARRPRRRRAVRAGPGRAPHRRLPRRRRPPVARAPTRRSTPSAASARVADAPRHHPPRGRVVMMGMPAEVTLDLTGLWHRETELVGAYTYGTETRPTAAVCRTFDLAIETADRHPGRALAQRHLPPRRPRRRHRPRRHAGRRGAVKIAFDLRGHGDH